MFNNLVNADDVRRLVEKLRQGYGRRLRGVFTPSADARVRAAWAHVEHPPKHWGSIPAVQRRWHQMITGDAGTEPRRHVAQQYFAQGGLHALSLGCGTGRNELRWAATGAFAHIDAYDLSDQRIRIARQNAEAEDLAGLVSFEAADVRTLPLDPARYDVVLAENVLHHISPLRDLITRLHATLRPGGYLVLRDFVGPARFQWTDRQVEAVAGVLALLPAAYRTRWGSGSVKQRFYRPGRLSMLLSDPSEAAESDWIVPLLREHFEEVAFHGLGGSILHLLFDDIAHHFLDDSTATQRWLDLCFSVEDALLESGEVADDFAFGVYRKPAG